jgi:hypothetical protein
VSKPLNEFGGWLTFFRICVILSFIWITIDSVLVLIALIAGPFMQITYSRQDVISAVIGVFACGILLFIQVQMIKIFKTQASIIPTQISKLFIIWLALLIASVGLAFVMYHFKMLPESLEINKFKMSIIAGSIIPFSCLAYFRWSRRVKTYYGANSFE